ncbi:putative Phytanoyl-CoA hydroxylase [Seiridium cardinale]|uniref:Phytanoyl-CoA hydroxylase n=1 Tax=Seiridium cardinale TaxID=138064 RepID=A0ABR2XLN2_9PEZI
MDPDAIDYLQPTSANKPIETMRALFKIDGYLYVGSLSPQEPAIRCRAAYFSFMATSGLLQPGSDAVSRTNSGANPHKYLPPGNLCHLFSLKGDNTSDKYIELTISAHEADFSVDFCQIAGLRDFGGRILERIDV